MAFSYSREERIKQLKDCGQSIIDNAENIVADFKYPSGINVTIEIRPHEVPIITTQRGFYAEGFVEGMNN